jgi:hypothetical protein
MASGHRLQPQAPRGGKPADLRCVDHQPSPPFPNKGWARSADASSISRFTREEDLLERLRCALRLTLAAGLLATCVLPLQAENHNYRIELIINSSLYPGIQSSVDQYIADLTASGDTANVILFTSGDIYTLKSILQDRYYNDGIDGALLVGDLPVPWFESEWKQGVGGPPVPGFGELFSQAVFPVDLFYMELDATWNDADQDGAFESLTPGPGDITPEIFVGRITCGPLGTETQLTKQYFQRVHDYKCGLLTFNDNGLMYVDDDWSGYWAETWRDELRLAYPEADMVDDPYTTSRADYLSRIRDPNGYEWIHVCSHAYPGGHGFYVGDDFQWVMAYEIPSLNPNVGFYQMFSCSFCRYTEPGYGGGQYVFNTSRGLACFGSTKTGSIWNASSFYQYIGEGRSIGDAFLHWWQTVGADGYDTDEICWFFGMTCLGDPLLRPQPAPLEAPNDWLYPGWNWVSFPLNPETPDPTAVMGEDVSGRFWEWDVYAKTPVVYHPPWSQFDIEPGQSYLYRTESFPPSVSYYGWLSERPVKVKLGKAGWAWVGSPSLAEIEGPHFLQSVEVQYPSTPSGEVRTAAQDRASGAPWLNWGWAWWDAVRQAPRTFTPYLPFGDNVCMPWVGYRAYATIGTATNPDDPDQVTLLWP